MKWQSDPRNHCPLCKAPGINATIKSFASTGAMVRFLKSKFPKFDFSYLVDANNESVRQLGVELTVRTAILNIVQRFQHNGHRAGSEAIQSLEAIASELNLPGGSAQICGGAYTMTPFSEFEPIREYRRHCPRCGWAEPVNEAERQGYNPCRTCGGIHSNPSAWTSHADAFYPRGVGFEFERGMRFEAYRLFRDVSIDAAFEFLWTYSDAFEERGSPEYLGIRSIDGLPVKWSYNKSTRAVGANSEPQRGKFKEGDYHNQNWFACFPPGTLMFRVTRTLTRTFYRNWHVPPYYSTPIEHRHQHGYASFFKGCPPAPVNEECGGLFDHSVTTHIDTHDSITTSTTSTNNRPAFQPTSRTR